MDGLFPIGYIEAERYGRDLNRLTGHAREQNERFIENLDNFILTNFVDFQLWTDGQLRTEANIEDGTEKLKTLLNGFWTLDMFKSLVKSISYPTLLSCRLTES